MQASDDAPFDVVVIGAGGSGLAAAAAASARGARTLLLEKRAHIGGTTRLAVGSISAARTLLQRRAGIEDSFEDFHHDMDAFTADLLPRDNPVLRRMLAQEAGMTIDWLESMGVAFAGPYPEPPHRVNRMHNTVPGPRMIIARLLATCLAGNTVVRTRASAVQLLIAPGGGVTGVKYSHGGRSLTAHAHGGVVLACGDFSGNAVMRADNLSQAAARSLPINPDNDGDGFDLARTAGARLLNMDMIFGPQMRFPRSARAGFTEWLPTWPWLARLSAHFFMQAPAWMLRPLVSSLLIANMSPSDELFKAGAFLVDAQGRLLDKTRPAVAIAQTADRKAWIIMSATVAKRFRSAPHFISTAPGIAFAYLDDYERGRPDLIRQAPDLEQLARSIGLPADHSLPEAAGPPEAGPWLALGPVLPMLTTTEGSASVDAQCRVLNQEGEPIAGLYGAGCIGQGGLLLRGHGLHLAWTFTSGRIAGEQALARARMD